RPESVASAAPDFRRWNRFKINLHLTVAPLVAGSKRIIPGYGRNLGEGGICAFIPAPLPAGDLLELELQFPGSSMKAKVRGKIRSSERFTYNIEFVDVDDRVTQLIAGACRALGVVQ
ncbi:MAG TPA: PilZ domain-containing protein, partial [Terriglobales bacterium]|nr:PilZ domain-containing protein [Terriglobales bacterium]